MIKKIAYIFVFGITLFAQMVPHPSLLKKIKSGEIEKPFVLKEWEQLKKRGIGGGWTDEELARSNSYLTKENVIRKYGPANPLADDFNALVLLVEFSDNPQQVSAEFFDDLIFEDSFSSMRGYFQEISYGELDIITVDLPSTTGWVTAPQPYSYYVDGQNGQGTYPKNSQGLAHDVVQIVDPSIDFSVYDNDGDGQVEALFIVFTGPGAEFTGSDDDIWSHAWSIPGGYSTDDGVSVFRYSVQPEYWQTPGDMTIGVYAHEAGHSVFGLPDLYDLDYSSYGTGQWSFMSVGSWNGFTDVGGDSPAWPDAWSHIQMGYASSFNVTANMEGEEITATTSGSDIYRLWNGGSASSEYFLLQNRQQVGYDAALPGAGLLIWHIDEAEPTNNNEWYPARTDSGHYKVALEQSDGDFGLEKAKNAGDGADPFPGSLSHTSFNEDTTPDSKAYDGTSTNVAVENISSSGPVMTVDLYVNELTAALNLISPGGGETWQGESFQNIEWTSTLVDNIKIELSTDGGGSWTVIGESVAADLGQFEWQVPNLSSANCFIRITDTSDELITDQSSAPFTITTIPQINLVSPNGGENWQGHSTQTIEWTGTDLSEVTLEFTTNNGSAWATIVEDYAAASGEYDWTVPNTPSSNCLVRISSNITGGIISDQSQSTFTITAGPMVEVVSPNGDEVWEVNSVQKIEWNSSAIDNIKIELSIDGGSSWNVVADNLTASTGEYNWTIPDNPSLNCLIKISSLSEPVYTDQSDGLFAISEEPSLQVVSPNGEEDYTVGDDHEISWNSINVDSVKIAYSTNAGANWITVVSLTPSDGVFSWTIPSTPSTNCLVMITDVANPGIKDTSDGSFIISPITPDAPKLISPADEEVNLELPITFEWETVEGAVAYDFQLSYDEAFTNIVHDRDGINSLTTNVNTLIEGMKFYWRVRAIGLEENSPFSEAFSFVTRITPPDGLVLTRDSNNPLRVNLNWNDNSNGETGYFIERAELDSSWGLHDLVDANETFWWEAVFKPEHYSYRVKAKSDFTESGYSNVVFALISGVDEEEIPTDYSLAQNYPNPFNPSTQINFGLPFESNVKLRIFNILGQTVAQLANETLQSGYHTLEWNASNLSSGIYFYSIEANSVSGEKTFNSVKKMILVK